MCSEYTTPRNAQMIEKALKASVSDKVKNFKWGSTIKFSAEGPVIQKSDSGQLELILKTFPVSPMPNSRLSGLLGQTDANAVTEIEDELIERIYEKKTWKDGFANAPVLVPAENFLEFAYWGPDIGTAQAFNLPNDDTLFIAGISITPYTPKGAPGAAYSLLTHTATEQMLQYHQRLLVVFEKNNALGYLEKMSPEERFNYVIKNRYTGKLNVKKMRSMAKS